jgi:hypothetical protein
MSKETRNMPVKPCTWENSESKLARQVKFYQHAAVVPCDMMEDFLLEQDAFMKPAEM